MRKAGYAVLARLRGGALLCRAEGEEGHSRIEGRLAASAEAGWAHGS